MENVQREIETETAPSKARPPGCKLLDNAGNSKIAVAGTRGVGKCRLLGQRWPDNVFSEYILQRENVRRWGDTRCVQRVQYSGVFEHAVKVLNQAHLLFF